MVRRSVVEKKKTIDEEPKKWRDEVKKEIEK